MMKIKIFSTISKLRETPQVFKLLWCFIPLTLIKVLPENREYTQHYFKLFERNRVPVLTNL